MITSKLPLSALTIWALLSINFVMCFKVLYSQEYLGWISELSGWLWWNGSISLLLIIWTLYAITCTKLPWNGLLITALSSRLNLMGMHPTTHTQFYAKIRLIGYCDLAIIITWILKKTKCFRSYILMNLFSCIEEMFRHFFLCLDIVNFEH